MTTPRKVDVLVYSPGSMQPVPHTLEAPDSEHLYAGIKDAMRALIGVGNSPEHVSVWFRGCAHDMFVDEFSAINRRAAFGKDEPDVGPEPVNETATLIYHEASRRRGDNIRNAPKIHGVAVITLSRVWF